MAKTRTKERIELRTAKLLLLAATIGIFNTVISGVILLLTLIYLR